METRVLYNDTCPVCRFEVEHYAARAARQGVPLRIDPLDRAADWGLTSDQAARRLHVVVDGRLLAGMPAFQAIWDQLPGYRWLARVTRWPVVRPAVGFVYDRVAAPLLYRRHLARVSRSGSPATSRPPQSR